MITIINQVLFFCCLYYSALCNLNLDFEFVVFLRELKDKIPMLHIILNCEHIFLYKFLHSLRQGTNCEQVLGEKPTSRITCPFVYHAYIVGHHHDTPARRRT